MKLNRREFIGAGGSLTVSFLLPGLAEAETRAALGVAKVSNRLVMRSDGSVKLIMAKGELGQGIGTALAQILADELDVRFSRVELTSVETGISADESYTFSSISIQQSGPPTRLAAAAARTFLLQEAARKLGQPATVIEVDDGVFQIAGKPSDLNYWDLLANRQLNIPMQTDTALKSPADYRVIGTSIQRIDIPSKVFGGESFLQDMRMPEMLHARVVRPPAERTALKRPDFESAREMPGVVKIVRDGNFVGVIAEREGQARDAAALLHKSLRWSFPADMPAADDLDAWLKQADSRLENVANEQFNFSSGAATRTVRASYQRPFQAHASISPSMAIALYQEGRMHVWSHAQGMYPLREALSHVLNLDVDSISCQHREASGCYGHNGGDDAACDAAVLAMQMPGRPVRLQWERADEFAWEPYGSAMHTEVSASIDREGLIREWNFDVWSCPHTGRPRSAADVGNLIYATEREESMQLPRARSIPQPNGGADRNAIPLYDFDNMNIVKHLVTDRPVRTSALRGLGAYTNVFAIESFMDELAHMQGEDPFAFRLKHLDNDRAAALLERLADESGWHERKSGAGWGMAFAQFKNRSSYFGIVMRLDVRNGRIQLKKATAVCDAGLVINPDGTRAQLEGGIIQSASWTLKEHVRFSRERKQSLDWASYPILRFDEVPDIDVVLMEQDAQPSLGVGETAQGPTAAAIGNALFDQTQTRLRRLPLVLETTS
jgi:CO/xanthine dehydrogenase Mo-binding subunit